MNMKSISSSLASGLVFVWLACGLALTLPARAQHSHEQHRPNDEAAGQASPAEDSSADVADMQMSHHDHDMGPHMKMTALRPPQPGDDKRAQQVVNQLRASLEKYQDHEAAVADGYKEFLPKSPGKIRHFTNYSNAMAAAAGFEPSQPTSLLYEKSGGDYKLIGAMFTAPKKMTEDELNARVPLSVAQWHAHVNICWPPMGTSRQEMKRQMMPPHAKFGLAGSIASEDACAQAGGRWMPQIFGWMVHVYPFERDADKVWSMERQEEQMHHMH